MEKENSSQQKEENLVALILRPQDKGWIMGEDWEVRVSYLLTLADLKSMIEEQKGISRHRIQLRLKGKVLVPNRENWTLRRTGIYDGYMVMVEPTLSGSWYWNPYEYYADKLLNTVQVEIANANNKRMNIVDLSAKVVCPPIVKTSLRVFLRKYPEHIHIHVDTTNNLMWVSRPQYAGQLPSFDSNPVELGSIEYFEPEPFDWEAHADIDDMYKLEAFEALNATATVSATAVPESAESTEAVAADGDENATASEGGDGKDDEAAGEGDASADSVPAGEGHTVVLGDGKDDGSAPAVADKPAVQPATEDDAIPLAESKRNEGDEVVH